jgi:hypothetical protein
VTQSRPTSPSFDIGGLDHDWLRQVLGWSVEESEEIRLRSISRSAGEMGEVYRVSCGTRSFVLKGPPREPDVANGLVADSRLIEREVSAYRFLRDQQIRQPLAPECYWSTLHPDGDGALALEDLGVGRPLEEVMAEGLDRAQAAAALESLAVLHASCAALGGDPLSAPYPWLYTADSDLLGAWIQSGVEDLPRLVSALWLAGLGEVSELRAAKSDLDALITDGHLGSHLSVLCHGDVWAGNIIFVPAGDRGLGPRALLIDWQFAMWGNPMSDVALLLMSSLQPQARAAWEPELIQRYHGVLLERSGLEYPLSACWEDLGRAEPFAAAVALATLQAYTSGMSAEQLSRFASRVAACVRKVAEFR